MNPPVISACGETDSDKAMIAAQCDAYAMRGDDVEGRAVITAEMKARRAALSKVPMTRGVAVSATPTKRLAPRPRASRPRARFPLLRQLQWPSGTELERELTVYEYSVYNLALSPALVAAAERVHGRIAAYEAAIVDSPHAGRRALRRRSKPHLPAWVAPILAAAHSKGAQIEGWTTETAV